MATEADILNTVRLELGDLPTPFRDSFRGNGEQQEFDLSARNITASSVTAFAINADGSLTSYTNGVDFTLDALDGVIKFAVTPEEDTRFAVEGTSYGMFSDDDLSTFLDAAVGQHLLNRTVQRRYRDGRGFIQFEREPMTLADLPKEENILVGLLATIEALWALSTDAATDIDVQTAEGTSIPRAQRWRQLTAQIDLLTNKYKDLSLNMGVGLFAPEVNDLRRVSRTTGRLVPIFQEREYDEVGPPIRKNPKINTKDSDPDGPPTPWFSGGWGF